MAFDFIVTLAQLLGFRRIPVIVANVLIFFRCFLVPSVCG